jgi:hypothetical protein
MSVSSDDKMTWRQAIWQIVITCVGLVAFVTFLNVMFADYIRSKDIAAAKESYTDNRIFNLNQDMVKLNERVLKLEKRK